MTVREGDVVGGRYRLLRLLGEGGMGAVWAAIHMVTGKGVAVKFLRAELTTNLGLVERFLREARAACSVRHPNVVQIHDVLTLESGAPAMVMELLDGESLGEKLSREGRLPIPEFSRLMTPVLGALAAAHAEAIVHRDLKPDNLFLVKLPDGGTDVKVLDFGIAKVSTTEQASGQLTKTGSMLGTPFYMSPEQLFGEKDVDARSDIWALGIIFYECLSGVLPTFADNLGQIIKTVTSTGIPSLASVAPHVPAPLSTLVDRMLARERSARPSNLDEIRAVVAVYGGASSTVVAGPARPIQHVVHAAPADAPTEDAPAPPPVARGTAALAGPAVAIASARPAAFVRTPTERMPGPTGDIQWSSSPPVAPTSRTAPLVVGLLALAVLLGVAGVLGVPRLVARSRAAAAAATEPSSPASSTAAVAPSSAAVAASGASAAEPTGAALPEPAASGVAAVAVVDAGTIATRGALGGGTGPRRAASSTPGTAASAAPMTHPRPAQPSGPGPLEEKVPF